MDKLNVSVFLLLGTHDTQDAIVSVGPMPGTVTVSVTYAVNTSALGHLAILVNSSNMAVSFTAQERSSQPATISRLLADEYTALVFDIELTSTATGTLLDTRCERRVNKSTPVKKTVSETEILARAMVSRVTACIQLLQAQPYTRIFLTNFIVK